VSGTDIDRNLRSHGVDKILFEKIAASTGRWVKVEGIENKLPILGNRGRKYAGS